MRALAVVAIAGPLVASDLWLKAVTTTPAWAYHARSAWWAVLCVLLVPLVVLLARIRSRVVLVAAGLLLAGLVGNLSSALPNGLVVENPIVAGAGPVSAAFNLADLYALAGILGATVGVCTFLVRHRASIGAAPSPLRDGWGSDRRPLT